ncbi:MAG: hypothetical protein ACXWRE_04195 [Pseudobdellovibrionaceae bacterium]
MRISTRFKPDPLDYALIDFQDVRQDEKNDFTPSAIGLILNESYTGCALVIKTRNHIIPNKNLRIQVGKLAMMSAKIIWVKVLEEAIVQVGVQFLD